MSPGCPCGIVHVTKQNPIPGGTMQINYNTHLSTRDYIKQSGWQNARLKTCPNNPDGDCRLHRHGTYARKYPDGMRVARHYCRSCRMTFSLLPVFMAAGCPGTLDDIEQAVLVHEDCGTVSQALKHVRPNHHGDIRAQRRWLQRRTTAAHLMLATVKGLLPDLWSGVAPTLASFRQKGPPAHVLMTLRIQCEPWLRTLPRPVGFHRRERPVESQTGPPTDDGQWQAG